MFGFGLLPRLALILVAIPDIHTRWFVPFLTSIGGIFADPWGSFLAQGGDPLSFPYGGPFLLMFAPTTLIGGLIGGAYGAHIGLALAVLGCELVLLWALRRIAPHVEAPAAPLLYWLSPIPIYVCYWHGQLDAFPTALMLLAFLAICAERHARSGILFGLSIAAKSSMALAMPFVALYYVGRRRTRRTAKPFLIGLIATGALLLLPLLPFAGFRMMVFGTREMQKVFSAIVEITPERSVYILPLLLAMLFYWAWRVRRMDFLMLWAFVALAFFAILLLTTASPGWIMWLMPFLVTTPIRRQMIYRMVQGVFAASYIGLQLISSTGSRLVTGEDWTGPFAYALSGFSEHLPSIFVTMLIASGGILAVQLARAGILSRPYHVAGRKPFSLGVAGDSGAGKDTLIDAVQGLFETDETSRLSGDDYHRWDRQGPMWRATTHLHPQANDLETFTNHVLALSDGRNVVVRHYDHETGRYSARLRIDAHQFVLVSGLHALWSPSLIDRYDVRIFMDMDEDLRRFVKMQRDVNIRGYAPEKVIQSFEKRQPDRERFILPQLDNAAMIFRLEPRHPSAIADLARPLQSSQLRLEITLARGLDFDLPARLLMSLCGVHVVAMPLPDGRVRVIVDGEPTAEDIAAVARRLVPDMMIYLALEPQWRGGMTGVMQLAVLYELDSVRRKRELAA